MKKTALLLFCFLFVFAALADEPRLSAAFAGLPKITITEGQYLLITHPKGDLDPIEVTPCEITTGKEGMLLTITSADPKTTFKPVPIYTNATDFSFTIGPGDYGSGQAKEDLTTTTYHGRLYGRLDGITVKTIWGAGEGSFLLYKK